MELVKIAGISICVAAVAGAIVVAAMQGVGVESAVYYGGPPN